MLNTTLLIDFSLCLVFNPSSLSVARNVLITVDSNIITVAANVLVTVAIVTGI